MEALGPRRSLARLLDVLGSRGRMLVHGGVGLLVSHLRGRRGEVFVALSRDRMHWLTDSEQRGDVLARPPMPRLPASLHGG